MNSENVDKLFAGMRNKHDSCKHFVVRWRRYFWISDTEGELAFETKAQDPEIQPITYVVNPNAPLREQKLGVKMRTWHRCAVDACESCFRAFMNEMSTRIPRANTKKEEV